MFSAKKRGKKRIKSDAVECLRKSDDIQFFVEPLQETAQRKKAFKESYGHSSWSYERSYCLVSSFPLLISKMQMTACYLLNGYRVLCSHLVKINKLFQVYVSLYLKPCQQRFLSQLLEKPRCFNRTFDIYLDPFEIEWISSLILGFKASFNLLLTELFVEFY